jgi:hypothetical protein
VVDVLILRVLLAALGGGIHANPSVGDRRQHAENAVGQDSQAEFEIGREEDR